MKRHKEKTNEKLTFKDLANITKTKSPNKCMLLLEMTCRNQEKVMW